MTKIAKQLSEIHYGLVTTWCDITWPLLFQQWLVPRLFATKPYWILDCCDLDHRKQIHSNWNLNEIFFSQENAIQKLSVNFLLFCAGHHNYDTNFVCQNYSTTKLYTTEGRYDKWPVGKSVIIGLEYDLVASLTVLVNIEYDPAKLPNRRCGKIQMQTRHCGLSLTDPQHGSHSLHQEVEEYPLCYLQPCLSRNVLTKAQSKAMNLVMFLFIFKSNSQGRLFFKHWILNIQ